MPINPLDYGLEWQNAQLATLPEQARLQILGGGQVIGYDPRNIDAHMNSLSSYLGPSLYSDSPSATFTKQNLDALAMFFPAMNQQEMSMMDINRTASDIKSPFTPYYFGASSEGYSAPIGKAGPGGVIFNSGLGKTNENPGDYKTPGAGLWAAGFDLNDPLLTQKLYDYFGRNRGPVFDKYKPQKLEDGSYRKATPQEALAFVSDADEWFRKEALKMDLPKRGIMDSLAGQLITGALIGAATGGFGTIVGGLTGSSALGNLASLAVKTAIGGAQNGWGGALTSALGSSLGAGIDQAGGWSNIGDFLSDPFGYIGSAYGIGGGAFSGLNLAGMEGAAQVGPGSLAQNTTGGYLSPTGEYVPLQGGYAILPGGSGQIPEIGITGPKTGIGPGATAGSSLTGGGAGSLLGGVSSNLASIFGGGGGTNLGNIGGPITTGINPPSLDGGTATSGAGSTGGPTTVDSNIGDGIGSDIGNILGGAGASTGIENFGTGASGFIYGPDGLPIGTAGPYSDASEKKFDIIGNMIPNLGPWDFTGTTSGLGTPNVTGLLDTGTAGTGPGGTGPGGDGLGGDGLGGDGTGTGGLGDPYNMFDYSGLLGGMTPGSIGEPASFITPRPIGVKKKGPASFYGKLQAPKKRKGITVRRA